MSPDKDGWGKELEGVFFQNYEIIRRTLSRIIKSSPEEYTA